MHWTPATCKGLVDQQSIDLIPYWISRLHNKQRQGQRSLRWHVVTHKRERLTTMHHVPLQPPV